MSEIVEQLRIRDTKEMPGIIFDAQVEINKCGDYKMLLFKSDENNNEWNRQIPYPFSCRYERVE